MTNKLPHVLWTLAVVGAVAGGVAALALSKPAVPPAKGGAAKASEPLVIKVAPVQREALRQLEELPGTVEATRIARLGTPAEGRVARVFVREGDRVEAGAPLVLLEQDPGLQARAGADRQELRRVQDDYARVKRLAAEGALPREQVEVARVAVERARAAVTTGREGLADFEVQAAWAGVVSKVNVEEGNYVAPRAVLVEMFDPASLVVRVALREGLAFRVPLGSEVEVAFDAQPGSPVAGVVSRLFPELERRLRTRPCEVSVATPPAGWAPGMFARVAVVEAESPNALTIPAAAVVRGANGAASRVFVLEAGQETVRSREVALGLSVGPRVEVLTGLAEGERVAVGGGGKLKDGARVKVQPAKPKGAGGEAPAGAPAPKAAKPSDATTKKAAP